MVVFNLMSVISDVAVAKINEKSTACVKGIESRNGRLREKDGVPTLMFA